jgi:hypothetical protein
MKRNFTPSSLKKIFTDKEGKVVIWQMPNLPLWGWIVFTILSIVVSKGKLHTAFKYVSTISLAIWAIMEIAKGASYFRRFLGFVVAVWIIVSRL